jgi:hypothetical protein
LVRKLVPETATGPLGTRSRYFLWNPEEDEIAELSGMITYGIIRGRPIYLACASVPTLEGMVDLGYNTEEIILTLTAEGFGTCWVGGTFSKRKMKKAFPDEDGLVIHILSPIGIPAERPWLVDSVMKRAVRSMSRKQWDQLFYSGKDGRRLSQQEAGPYDAPLEAVRLAPSAANKQPWRILKEGETFHFFNGLETGASFKRSLSWIDMGIALFHFSTVAEEKGLPGRILRIKPEPHFFDSAYTASWKTADR